MDYKLKGLSFKKRPIPIPAEYRPMFKLSQIALILHFCCRSNTSSLLKLHLFSWALKSDGNMKLIIDWVLSNFSTEFEVWGIEPALNRALTISVAEEICNLVDGKYVLTEKGERFVSSILADKELFINEIKFLKSIGKNKITDDRIVKLSKKWSLFNDEN